MNNPLAFPSTNDKQYREEHDIEYGMTLRDYFAAKALQGIMAAANGTIKYKDLGEISYKAADAMLVERAKNTK